MNLLPLSQVAKFLKGKTETEKANLGTILINLLHYPVLPVDELISNALDDFYIPGQTVEEAYNEMKSEIADFIKTS